MTIKTGVDILHKSRFDDRVRKGKQAFLDKMFTPQELRQNSQDQLASVFCVKEAVFKALELPLDSWHDISTNRQNNGKIVVSILHKDCQETLSSIDTSISHDKDIIVAVVIVVLS